VSEFIAQHPILIVGTLKCVVVLIVLLTAVAYMTWFERKVIAHIQSRWGPWMVGPHGLLQPLADAVKGIFKEDPTPAGADKFVYYLAPFLSLSLALTSIALIPFGPEIEIFGHKTHFGVADVNIGLLFLFAITSLSVYGVVLAGWSSNNKYSLLGGLRSSAQMVSYELSLTLSVVGVLLMAQSFSLREIILNQQGHHWGIIPRWHIFAAPLPQVVGFLCYFIAAVAETNRAPFDLPEAEQELVAGFHTEYASMKFATFFIAEYTAMVTVAIVASLFFFGGWLSPFPASWIWTQYIPTFACGVGAVLLVWDGLRYPTKFGKVLMPILGVSVAGVGALCALGGVIQLVQGPFWFTCKIVFFLFVYVWIRGTLPRFRYDQLMGFGWKLLLPVALANVLLTALMMLVVQR
jgi:NADH-quinone oxidoreductase subunit H